MHHQHEADQLCIREGERNVLDLPHVVQVDDAAGELLEGSREDWRRHVEDLGLVILDDKPLQPVHHKLAPVGGLPEEARALGVHGVDVDHLERVVVELANLLKGQAVQQAAEPNEHVLEVLHLVVFGGVLGAEGEEVADGIEPLSADLVDERCPLPEAGVRLVVAEHYQEAENKTVAGPEREDPLHLLCEAVLASFRLPAQPCDEQRQTGVGNGYDHDLGEHRALQRTDERTAPEAMLV
mmetsp:Transcript_36074/g.81512  ORF Transcript_36074/g.81512 Transcript_36074/m.81512 type:complete len:239 (-) Transcript_36074:11-727(-)